MSKADELWESQSGLTILSALDSLHEKSFQAFEHFFLQIKHRGGGNITTKTASHIACDLTNGLYAPIFAQVDPAHVGEAGRAMLIADRYGRRLRLGTDNWTDEVLQFLTAGYPSHGFVIDRQEASMLFERVREPEGAEIELPAVCGVHGRVPRRLEDNQCPFEFLTPPVDAESGSGGQKASKGQGDGKDGQESSGPTNTEDAERDKRVRSARNSGSGANGRNGRSSKGSDSDQKSGDASSG
jgi:hypothetical protein